MPLSLFGPPRRHRCRCHRGIVVILNTAPTPTATDNVSAVRHGHCHRRCRKRRRGPVGGSKVVAEDFQLPPVLAAVDYDNGGGGWIAEEADIVVAVA